MRHIQLFLLLFSTSVWSQRTQIAPYQIVPMPQLHSQARGQQESVQSAFQRYQLRLAQLGIPIPLESALNEAKPLELLTYEKVAAYQNGPKAVEAFTKFRDTRFIKDTTHQMMRRSSWLFPDDGCFARAALAIQNLKTWNLPVPSKLFIFGNLTVKTKNSPTGTVSWWYHVVPIVLVGQQPVILDPAINPEQPMLLKDWIGTMTNDLKSTKFSVCRPSTYAPSSPCSVDSASSASALEDQMTYLNLEWARIQKLNRDPVRELGDYPPWHVPFSH